jgi:two-component system phosphate regulon response regulator PhoB
LERILCIEGHPAQGLLLADLLEREGYQVEAAGDGSEGLAQARLQVPDLVLVDLNLLPPVDGFEVIRILRSDLRTANVPIFAISAWLTKKYREQAFEAGADQFINIPYIPDDLVMKIKRYLALDSEDLKRLRTEAIAPLKKKRVNESKH